MYTLINSKTVLKNNGYSVLKYVINKTNINQQLKEEFLNDFINSNFNNITVITKLSFSERKTLKDKLKKSIVEQASISKTTREVSNELIECAKTLKYVFMILHRYENNETDLLLKDKSNINNSKNTTYYNSYFYRNRVKTEEQEIREVLYKDYDDDDYFDNLTY